MLEHKGSGCVECMRYGFIIFNGLFLVTGVLLLFLGVWFYSVPANQNLSAIVFKENSQNQIRVLMLLVICVSCGICFSAILSCCAAFSQSRCVLIAILSSIGILLLAEVYIISVSLVFVNALRYEVSNQLTKTLVMDYAGDYYNNTESIAWMEMQKAFDCCGVNTTLGYKNHTNAKYNGHVGSRWYRENSHGEEWPASCCSVPNNQTDIDAVALACSESANSYLNKKGCQNDVQTFIEVHLMATAGISAFIGLLQIVAAAMCYKLYKDVQKPENPTKPSSVIDGYDQFDNTEDTG